MKIYIASKYLEHSDINRKIYDILIRHGFDVFLPESINIEGKTENEMRSIADICYDAIDLSDIILLVSPFGQSVSAEIGYGIYKKRHQKNTKIVSFRYTHANMEKEKSEAMIIPFYDYSVDATIKDVDTAIAELVQILFACKG